MILRNKEDNSVITVPCVPKPKDVMKDTGIKIVVKDGKWFYQNEHGYIHCDHNRNPLIEVITSFGNKSFVCNQCGQTVKRELMPTS